MSALLPPWSTGSLVVVLPLIVVACGGAPPSPPPGPGAAGDDVTVASPACAAPAADCDGETANGCETDLLRSGLHCGECGDACAAGTTCAAGACRVERPLSAFQDAVCAVSGGSVYCWGKTREIFAGDRSARHLTPAKLDGVEDAHSVLVGAEAAWIVTRPGKLLQYRGGEAHEVDGVSGVTDVAARGEAIHVTTETGGLWSGHLHPTTQRAVLSDLHAREKYRALAGGSAHTCALRADGRVTCFKTPTEGQVRALPALGSGDPESEPETGVPVVVVGLERAARIAAGLEHTCAVRLDGTVACWGAGRDGQLGDGAREDRYSPVDVPGITDAVEITAGSEHTCIRRRSGGVVCWGEGRSAQLGGRPGPDHRVEVKGIDDAAALAAGARVSCALLRSGKLTCWGAASGGALGDGTDADHPSPARVLGVGAATEIAAGERFSCARDTAGSVRCWGHLFTAPGQESFHVPTLVPGLRDVQHLAPSREGLCVVNKAQEVRCHRQGEPWRDVAKLPLGPVRSVFPGDDFSLAISPAGQVLVWGPGASGKIEKKNLPGLGDATSAAIQGEWVCVVRRTGKVACVKLAERPFAPGSPAPVGPVEIAGIEGAVEIGSHHGETLVLKKEGSVVTFEAYAIDLRPDPSGKAPVAKAPANMVSPVPGVSGAAHLAVGAAATCAVLRDGHLSCWGRNAAGSLGTGDFEDRPEPTVVPGLTDVQTVTLGPSHTCAVTRSGQVHCWGANVAGQAGQPGPAFAWSPVEVTFPVAR